MKASSHVSLDRRGSARPIRGGIIKLLVVFMFGHIQLPDKLRYFIGIQTSDDARFFSPLPLADLCNYPVRAISVSKFRVCRSIPPSRWLKAFFVRALRSQFASPV